MSASNDAALAALREYYLSDAPFPADRMRDAIEAAGVWLPGYERENAMWDTLTDVPVDDDGKILEPWHIFEAGTDREYIWHWFEDKFPGFSVARAQGAAP